MKFLPKTEKSKVAWTRGVSRKWKILRSDSPPRRSLQSPELSWPISFFRFWLIMSHFSPFPISLFCTFRILKSVEWDKIKANFINFNLNLRFVFAWNNIIDSYLTVKAIFNFFILLDRLYCILKSSFLQFSSFALRFFIHFSLNFYLNDAPVLLNVKFNANFIWVLNSSHK